MTDDLVRRCRVALLESPRSLGHGLHRIEAIERWLAEQDPEAVEELLGKLEEAARARLVTHERRP